MSGAGIVLVTAIVVAALLCLYVVWRQRRNRTKRLIGDLLKEYFEGRMAVEHVVQFCVPYGPGRDALPVAADRNGVGHGVDVDVGFGPAGFADGADEVGAVFAHVRDRRREMRSNQGQRQ